jgi:DNA-binding transcriptional regulator GbsR (MarR family)
MRVLTENDYRVMARILNRKENKGLSKTTGLTRNELKELASLSYTKIGDALNALIEYDFVSIGISKGREKTYFLTANGLNELNSLAQQVINIKKKESVDNE